jgi:hypothetical protein
MSTRTITSLLAASAISLAFGATTIGCSRQEPTAGEKIEEAAGKMGEAVKEAGEEAGKQLDEATDDDE